MAADSPSGRLLIGVVAGIQDVLLYIAEDRFIRIIVRASLGQTGPSQAQPAHHSSRHPGLDRMCRIAIQGDPHRLRRIPPEDAPQESADIRRPFAGEEGPVDATMVHLVEQEEIESPSGLLVPLQHQALGSGVTSAAIRLDGYGLDIEEGKDGAAGTVLPPSPQPVQDHTPIGIVAEKLALDATQGVPPFFNTLRRCSRLIALTTRRWMRYAQLGQAPAAERQAQGCGRLASHLPDGRDLLTGQARRGPHRAWPAQRGHAVSREVAEVGVHGVDMHMEQLGHGRGGETSGKEQEHFRATTLPRLQGLLEPSMDAVEFRRGRLPSTQGRDMARPPWVKLLPF